MKKTKTIARAEALRKIHETNGEIFKVVFRKKTTGKFRRMVCRLGVKKHVKGVGLAFNPKDYRLINVFDMLKIDEKTGKKGAYRFINTDTLSLLKTKGEIFRVR